MLYRKSLYSLGSHNLNAVGLLGVNQDKLIDLFGGGNHDFGGYWRQVGYRLLILVSIEAADWGLLIRLVKW